MLGWSFLVKELDTNKRLDYWEGGLFADEWLQEGLRNKSALPIMLTGGYPNTYIITHKLFKSIRGIVESESDWFFLEVWDQS